jgi:hypothetical protein
MWAGVPRAASSGFLRRGIILVLMLAPAACGGGSESRQLDFSIIVPSGQVAAGAAQQLTVDTDEPVLWGVASSGAEAALEPPVYPVEVAPNGRYLVDATGAPWRVQADAGWTMSTEATAEQVDQYLATRRAQGFNSFYLHAMLHPGGYPDAHDPPRNRAGDAPFAVPDDFSSAGESAESERYWQWIDTIIEKAADHGMAVMLAYTYLGYSGGDQGWWNVVLAQPSRQALHDWGVWLGTRYEDDPNVIWLGLGDFTPPAGSEGALRVRAIAEGIKEAGATQLFLAETSPPDGIPGEVPDFGDLVDQNSFYGYGPDGDGAVYVTADRAWDAVPVKPAWMQEGTYEYEDNVGTFSGEPWDTRRARFWSVLAGGTAGDGFGSRDVWRWKDIPASLDSPGASYSTWAFDLFASMPWWELMPSGTAPGKAGVDLVTQGQGTWGELDYVTSAITEDHRWLLAYVPVTEEGARTLTVDMSAMAGESRAAWFDPASGTSLAIGDGYTNTGTREFTTPGTRGDDTDDWLLVVDASGDAPCGSITSDGTYTAPSVRPEGLRCAVTASLASDPGVVAREELILSG